MKPNDSVNLKSHKHLELNQSIELGYQ